MNAVREPGSGPVAARRRGRLLVVIAVSLLIALAGWGVWSSYRALPLRELPPVDLTQAPPAVRAAIERELAAVRGNPRSGKAWGRLGMVLRAHEFGTEANACLALAEKLDPRAFLWPYILGLSLQSTDPERASAAFRRAAGLDRTDALPHLRLGELLLEHGQGPEAAEEFQQALALEPDSARGRLGLARCALVAGDLPECRRLAEEASRRAPQQRAVRELLVQVCHRMGDAQGAESARQALARLPGGETNWDDRHVALVMELRRDPLWLARTAQEMLAAGRGTEAVHLLEGLVASDEANPRWSALLARALLAVHDYARAAQVLERATNRHPDSADLQLQRGALAFVQEDWPAAAAAFGEAARLKPDFSQAFYNLGHALRKLGDDEGAIRAFREAARLEPGLAAAHANLGALLARHGAREEGRQHLRLAVELDPDDASARRMLEEAK